MIPKMKERYKEERSIPDDEWIYHRLVDELITITRIIEYKNTCFLRCQNAVPQQRHMFPKIKKMILNQIRTNKKTTYRELLKIDTELDIETVLEHLIEEKTIKSIDESKKDVYEGTWGLLISPKQKWIINGETI